MALRVTQALVASMQAPFVLHANDGDINVGISASLGVAMYPINATKPDDLIRAADEAMYRIKRGGRNGCGMAQGAAQS
jgi:diguanylate cyclase (GGDEF)-like protein